MAEFQYLDGGNSEVQDMQAEAYLYASSGTTGIAASGVIEGLVVTQASTANGTVLIAAGACVNQASLGQGASRLINPSQKTLDIFTANPVGGLPRNDIVVFDSITKLVIAITGTPNATPTDPTVPATSVALARLRHAASATTIPTAKIDSLTVATTLRGIPVPLVHPAVARFYSVTLDASGYATITHGLGFTPTAVVCSPQSPITGSTTAAIFSQCMTDTFTSTTFRVRGLFANGVVVVGAVYLTAVLG